MASLGLNDLTKAETQTTKLIYKQAKMFVTAVQDDMKIVLVKLNSQVHLLY